MFSVGVFSDVGGETDSGRSLSGGVLSARHQLVYVLQQLRLARARITTQQYVNLGANATPARRRRRLLGRPAEQQTQYALLHVIVLIDTRRSNTHTTLLPYRSAWFVKISF